MATRFHLKLFIIVWLLIGATTNVRNQADFNLHHAGVDAVVEHGTFALGHSPLPIFSPGWDTYEFEGRTYANKQPGQFIFGALAYAPLRLIGLSYAQSFETVAVLVTWLSTGLLSALAAVALAELLLLWGRSRREASVTALLFTFATPLTGYFGVLYHDAIAADCFVIALAAVEIYRTTSRERWILGAGIVLGASITATMLAAASAPLLLIYALLRTRGDARFIVVLGFLLGLTPLLIYNGHYFHNPFLVGYVALKDPHVIPRFDVTHLARNVATYIVSGDIALIYYYPLLYFGFFGLFVANPLKRLERACLVLAVFAHFGFVSTMPTHGVCQNPPRFLLPLSGPLVVALPWAWSGVRDGVGRILLRAAMFFAAALSLTAGVTGALYGAMNCDLRGWLTPRQLLALGPWLTLRNFPLSGFCISALTALVVFRIVSARMRNQPRSVRRGCSLTPRLDVSRCFSRSFLRSAELPELFLGTLTVALTLLRFFFLETSPPGFYIDENAAAATVLCLREDGIDSQGNPVGLFARALGGGDFTPIFLRAAELWSSIFGESIGSFRALSAFFSVLAIWGIFLTGRILCGRRGALYCAASAAASPWLFQFARVFWDPALVPCFLVWGIYFFIRGGRSLREPILSALFFAAAAYSYPAARAQVPLMLAGAVLTGVVARTFSWRRTAVVSASFAAFCAPLFLLIMSGSLLGRFELVSVLAKHYLASVGRPGTIIAGVQEAVMNFPEHLSSSFLFTAGDANPRHGTGKAGVLSWTDGLAAAAALLLLPWLAAGYRLPRLQLRGAVALLIAGIFTGLLPSALTWESIPHALRAIGAAPFVCLLSGVILAGWAQQFPRTVAWTVLLVTGAYSVSFYSDYFFDYPRRAAESFDLSRSVQARTAARDGDWDAVFRLVAGDTEDDGNYAADTMKYYLIADAGLSCREALDSANRLRRNFIVRSRSSLQNG